MPSQEDGKHLLNAQHIQDQIPELIPFISQPSQLWPFSSQKALKN